VHTNENCFAQSSQNKGSSSRTANGRIEHIGLGLMLWNTSSHKRTFIRKFLVEHPVISSRVTFRVGLGLFNKKKTGLNVQEHERFVAVFISRGHGKNRNRNRLTKIFFYIRNEYVLH